MVAAGLAAKCEEKGQNRKLLPQSRKRTALSPFGGQPISMRQMDIVRLSQLPPVKRTEQRVDIASFGAGSMKGTHSSMHVLYENIYPTSY